MLGVLILSLGLAPAATPPAAAVAPAPVQCADADLAAAASPLFTAQGDIGELTTCFVSVDCGCGVTVSCSGNDRCRGVPRDCSAGQRGRVVCDGVGKPCPQCGCTDGTVRTVPTGQCCDCSQGGERFETQKCINGCWETTGEICKPSAGCPPPCQ